MVEAAIGRFLVSQCCYRTIAWTKILTSGGEARDHTVAEAYENIAREARNIRAAADHVDHHRCQVSHLDALTALDELTLLPESVVYADPAWPWKGPEQETPYEYFTYQVSSVLLQEMVPQMKFWKGRHARDALTDCAQWIRRALERGARYTVISTQNTNAPPVADVEEYLSDHFIPEWVGRKGRAGNSRTGKFDAWYGVYKGVR